jgi:hypothetical protein
MWGENISPPSMKVKLILDFYGIKYTWIKGKKKGDAYQFVPILKLGEL